jgi:F0F1-type ATP synthase membrane subunit a
MSGAKAAVMGVILAVAVSVCEQGMVRLVDASGARDHPALILVLLLAAVLGVLAAVVTRTLRLPGATAPTALVLGWILVPPLLGAIPSAATDLFARSAQLDINQALALAAATVAASVTLGVPGEGR